VLFKLRGYLAYPSAVAHQPDQCLLLDIRSLFGFGFIAYWRPLGEKAK
jgi:hypothetical protein